MVCVLKTSAFATEVIEIPRRSPIVPRLILRFASKDVVMRLVAGVLRKVVSAILHILVNPVSWNYPHLRHVRRIAQNHSADAFEVGVNVSTRHVRVLIVVRSRVNPIVRTAVAAQDFVEIVSVTA